MFSAHLPTALTAPRPTGPNDEVVTPSAGGMTTAAAPATIGNAFCLAMRAGATTAMLKDTIGIHPTLAEEFFSLD